MIETGFYGLHHTAFLSDAIDDDIERANTLGLELVCDIPMPDGARYAYLQSAELGEDIYIELLEATVMMKTLFKQGMGAAERWRDDTGPTELDMGNWKRLAASLAGAGVGWFRNKWAR